MGSMPLNIAVGPGNEHDPKRPREVCRLVI